MAASRIEKLKEMLQDSPDDLFLLYALGMEHLGLNNLSGAESYFRNVIGKDPNYIPAYYQLGQLLSQSNREEESLTFLNKGLELARTKKDLKTMNEFRSLIDEISM